MNPENGGMPARFIAGTKNSTASSGERLGQPAEPVDRRRAALPLDQPGDEEQRGLDGDVVDDVEDRAGQPGRRRPGRCRTPCSRCG